ncbi:hypothetical protein Tco_1410103 [Tanacetum coccineum]
MSSMELWLVLDLGCSLFLEKFDFRVYGIENIIFAHQNSFLSLVFIVSENCMDTPYGVRSLTDDQLDIRVDPSGFEGIYTDGHGVNQSSCGIFINQSNYVLEILKQYGMKTCDPIGTPMEIKDKLGLDQNGTVAKPTKKHLKEVKRIFRYLRGTVNMGLWYTKDSGFGITGFLDADYAGCRDTFKSTSGGTQFLGEKLVSWSSKKQECTSLSTAKAEYGSLSS